MPRYTVTLSHTERYENIVSFCFQCGVAVANFLVYIRGLLQEPELFGSVRGSNQDPIPSGGHLERAETLDQEQLGPFGDPRTPEATVRRGPWRDALVSKNPSYASMYREFPKPSIGILQGWGLSTDGELLHIDGGPLNSHLRLTK